MDLELTTTMVGQRLVVALAGIADLSTAPLLHDQLRRTCTSHPGETIMLDLDGLIAIDDAALGLLLGAAARARETGGDIELVCTNERVRSRLASTRLDRCITVRDAIV